MLRSINEETKLSYRLTIRCINTLLVRFRPVASASIAIITGLEGIKIGAPDSGQMNYPILTDWFNQRIALLPGCSISPYVPFFTAKIEGIFTGGNREMMHKEAYHVACKLQ
ncbi:hypothetical protein BABINDRAFT_85481 [Babjeviella inositovora NRRL Y-12698]|uniref:Uncharacterized protein n=1 Tax=Babjeviella inositovora NRRL Y-12698 TaxID=984486 RepID=A0A1E3QLH9_9ASCO|nr:uncharacterized protein BABINDRAFT_85481 [Babjeviella inositovora NRRL Y-12698]ODQ78510.1 hypothetical protein BABINDRAFT_85481 [Babjeviella inositovora NRRL Y-12698]